MLRIKPSRSEFGYPPSVARSEGFNKVAASQCPRIPATFELQVVKNGSNYHGLRIVVGALCFVGGFFFPLLFIPAVLIGMTLSATPEEQHEPHRPQPKAAAIEQEGINAADPGWKSVPGGL